MRKTADARARGARDGSTGALRAQDAPGAEPRLWDEANPRRVDPSRVGVLIADSRAAVGAERDHGLRAERRVPARGGHAVETVHRISVLSFLNATSI